MRDACPSPEEIQAILLLDPSSPRRLHVERCPRCRTLLQDYSEFLQDRSVPPGADPRDAAERLRESFRKASGEASPAAEPVVATPRARRTVIERLFPRILRPLWVTAAVLLIAIGAYRGIETLRRPPESTLLRGAPAAGSQGTEVGIAVLPPVWEPDGALEIRWHPARGIDSYQVLLIGPDLTELDRVGPTTDTLLVVPSDRVRAALPSEGLAGYEVRGSSKGSPAATSGIRTIHVP